jgi:hypothetical protein
LSCLRILISSRINFFKSSRVIFSSCSKAKSTLP